LQLIGKEVIATATYFKLKKEAASIDGGIAETVQQLSALPNTDDFSYSSAPFNIKWGTAKICRIRYKSGKDYVRSKVIFIVPNSDIKTAYEWILQ